MTNEWASTIIGRTLQEFWNSNSSFENSGAFPNPTDPNRSGQSSAGYSQAYEFEVQPSTFSSLKTGGPEHQRVVEAILFQNGKRFQATGRPWMRACFEQEARKSEVRRAT